MALANGVLVHGPTSWGAPCAPTTDRSGWPRARSRASRPACRRRSCAARSASPRRSRCSPRCAGASPRPGSRSSARVCSLPSPSARRSAPPPGARRSPRAFARRWSPWPRSSLPRWRCAGVSSRGTTARSTSRSGATSTTHLRRRSTSAAARISSARCSSPHCGRERACPEGAALARPAARLAGTVGAVGASVEVFAWMSRHPGHPLAARSPARATSCSGRVSTEDPSTEQLEVAEAALAACLELEELAA